MDWKNEYARWKNQTDLDEDIQVQLQNVEDEKKLEDCFYKNLEFGTGGMRGEIGPGTNRMNRYTIRKASEGLARYIEENGEVGKKKGVVIAYDSRHCSMEFAKEAALTLGNHGIQTYVFNGLRPTPELSFAVRYLNAYSGIVITASHNPPQYNGYKVYGDDGGQLPPEKADEVIAKVNEVENELTVEVADEQELKQSGLFQIIGDKVDQAYIDQLKSIVVNQDVIDEMKDLKIVFTPLHGTGNFPVREGLKALGFENVTVVDEQEQPDPEFSTVDSPNPEEHAAFRLAIEYGKKINADVLLATDPDADRVGVAVKNNEGEYTVLSGNQTGALMLHYLLSQKQNNGGLPDNGIVLKTIVTSEIGRMIANSFGIPTVDTLTGFKFIGEKMKQYHTTGEHQFLFGYEESYGYLIGDFVRDKDAVQACLLAAEIAAFYKKQKKSLYDGLYELFETYGFYLEALESLTLKGKQGAEQIQKVMDEFRHHPPLEMAGRPVSVVEDYLHSEQKNLQEGTVETIELPSSNVLKYFLDDGSWFCLRPSGTEPKIKFYIGVCGETLQGGEKTLRLLKAALLEQVHRVVEKNDH